MRTVFNNPEHVGKVNESIKPNKLLTGFCLKRIIKLTFCRINHTMFWFITVL